MTIEGLEPFSGFSQLTDLTSDYGIYIYINNKDGKDMFGTTVELVDTPLVHRAS